MSHTPHTVAIVSGGMDSAALAHLAAREGRLDVVSFDYGQRHHRELDYAERLAGRLDADHWDLIRLPELAVVLRGSASALTNPDVAVPHGHYADETMRATVVPNRNMVMLALAGSVAVARGADRVGIGVHSGDHAVYPDCRPNFVLAMTAALQIGTEGFGAPDLHVWAPFVFSTKAEIAAWGHVLGVDWRETWSCYEGGAVHCGACGTCVERREAFALAGVDDPTEYAVVTIP